MTSNQEIFDNVVTYLSTQTHKSAEETTQDRGGRCYYRAPDGNKCAVGCMLTDAEYNPSMDDYGPSFSNGNDVYGIEQRDLLPERLVPFVDLLAELQNAHDRANDVGHLKSRLLRVAQDFDLDPKLVDTLTFNEGWH